MWQSLDEMNSMFTSICVNEADCSSIIDAEALPDSLTLPLNSYLAGLASPVPRFQALRGRTPTMVDLQAEAKDGAMKEWAALRVIRLALENQIGLTIPAKEFVDKNVGPWIRLKSEEAVYAHLLGVFAGCSEEIGPRRALARQKLEVSGCQLPDATFVAINPLPPTEQAATYAKLVLARRSHLVAVSEILRDVTRYPDLFDLAQDRLAVRNEIADLLV